MPVHDEVRGRREQWNADVRNGCALQVVLSVRGMNQIICFDKDSGVLVSEAGVVLEAADNYLREQGHIMPIDLGAKGSCVVHTHHPSLNLAVNGLR